MNKNSLEQKDYEWLMTDPTERAKTQLSQSMKMLDNLNRALPRYDSKYICDVPLDFRADGKTWFDAESNGLTMLKYWCLYRVASYYIGNKKPELCLEYATKALLLLPPLQIGELPHQHEVLVRLYRYMALEKLGYDEQSLAECRMLIAAIRLLHHEGRVDMNDPGDILISKSDVLPFSLIQHTVNSKMKKEGTMRPYFTQSERVKLWKELGVGLYSKDRYKCHTCGKTNGAEGEKLSLCSRCNDVWYCSIDCSRKGWKGGHKQSCGLLPVNVPMKLSTVMYAQVITPLLFGKVSIVDSSGSNYLLALAQEDSDGEIFDVLTDIVVHIEEDPSQNDDIQGLFASLGLKEVFTNDDLSKEVAEYRLASKKGEVDAQRKLHEIRAKARGGGVETSNEDTSPR